MVEPTDREVFDQLNDLVTESVNERSTELDRLSIRDILEAMSDEDGQIAAAVRSEIPAIERAVEEVVDALGRGGRLIYVGAGTSGRLGVLDAAECPPTFGTDPDQVIGVIAGGPRAVRQAIEGAEDRGEEAISVLSELAVSERDCVVGIAASSRTPYVLSALAYARRVGASTVFLTCNPAQVTPLRPRSLNADNRKDRDADVVISPMTGPEIIMGSTRLKAGTATKMVLNMISTAAMVRLGKVYGNLMVDLVAASQKLRERGKRLVMMVTGADYEEASSLLNAAGGRVKTAIVMRLLNVDRVAAEERLRAAGGFVRDAVEGEGS